MVKITKTLQPKHKESMSKWLAEYVQNAASAPLPNLPRVLKEFPPRWPFPRGDMYHWVPLLNRFDNILECFVDTYDLREGPQMRDFGCEVLLRTSPFPVDYRDTHQWTREELEALDYGEDGDAQLILDILGFTRNLLQHCGNRSIYSSSALISCLLNSSSLHILKAGLHVSHELALRYNASYKRSASNNHSFHSALLANHYNIDLTKVQQLALPFVKTPLPASSSNALTMHPPHHPHTQQQQPPSTPMAGTSSASGTLAPPPSTPVSKGKDKAQRSSAVSPRSAAKIAASMYTNDFVAIATSGPANDEAWPDDAEGRGSSDEDWNSWGDIKVSYYPLDVPPQPGSLLPEVHHSAAPSTPTPLRRTSNLGPQSDVLLSPATPATPHDDPALAVPASAQKTFTLTWQMVQTCETYDLIARCPADMPRVSRYEVLNRIRIAKALMGPLESRQLALAVRLLAITNLAYIHPETTFLAKVLKQDSEEAKRYQLVYQLAELIRPGAGFTSVPIWLQSIALQLLESLSGFPSKTSDVIAAVNATVNHGVLLYVLRTAVADMKEDKDEPAETTTLKDDWRKQLFSLTLSLAAGSRMNDIMAAGLMEILIEALTLRSATAERNFLVIVTFLDSVVINFPQSFQPFGAAHGLDVVARLLVDMVDSAKKSVDSGVVTRADMRCSVIDYDIPFYVQQTLKWLLKFIYHLMANSFQLGAGNDRLLRNLVDDSKLLGSLRTILENTRMFGSVVWTNAATTLSHFLNHEPTSYAALSEAGMIQSFLVAITGQPLPEIEEESADKADESAGGSCSNNNADGNEEQGEDNENGSAAGEEMDFEDTEDDDEDEEGHSLNNSNYGRDSPFLESKHFTNRTAPMTFEELKKPRDWTLAGGILPSAEAITAVPSILNSISLNYTGRKMVVASGALERYLEIFESPTHMRVLDNDPDLAPNVGAAFDELARHHPSLRPPIASAVLGMVSRVSYLVSQKAEEDGGWGAQLIPLPELTDHKNDEDDVDMTDAAVPSATPAAAAAPPMDDAKPYIKAVASFLDVYLNNRTLRSLFIQRGGIELVLDLVTSRALPFYSASSWSSVNLQHILVQLFEKSAVVGVPSLLYRVKKTLDEVEGAFDFKSYNRDNSKPMKMRLRNPGLLVHYTEASSSSSSGGGGSGDSSSSSSKQSDSSSDSDSTVMRSSAFSPFLAPDGLKWPKSMLETMDEKARLLVRVQYLLDVVQVCFTVSRGSTSMYNVNVFDYYKAIIEHLGPLLTFAMTEEAALLNAVPSHWSVQTSSSVEVSSSALPTPATVAAAPANAGAANDAPAAGTAAAAATAPEGGSSSAAASANQPAPAQPQATSTVQKKLTKEEQATPAYRNFKALHSMLHTLPTMIVRFYQTLGKALLPHRLRHVYMRHQHLKLAKVLVSTFLDHLRRLNKHTLSDLKMRNKLLESLRLILVNDTRHNDRPGSTPPSHIIVPLLLAFKSLGGFETLNTMLQSYTKIATKRPIEDARGTTQMYLASVGMEIILDLYSVLVNGRNVRDSVNAVHVFSRSSDRIYPPLQPNQPGSQLVVELRAAVLPTVVELWQSSAVESVSTEVLSKLIEIMKTVAAGEMELGCCTREQRPAMSPTDVFHHLDTPFPWSDFEHTSVARAAKGWAPDDLALEALYRSHGDSELCLEYTTLHKAKLAGPRHPVPQDDYPKKMPWEDKAGRDSATTSSEGPLTLPGMGGGMLPPRLPFPIAPPAYEQPNALDEFFIDRLMDMAAQPTGDAEGADADGNDETTAASGSAEAPQDEAAGSSDKVEGESEGDKSADQRPMVFKDDLEKIRQTMRADLIDRCLSVIQMHPEVVFDIAELISTSVARLPSTESAGAQQEVGETLTEALMSFAIDEEHKKTNAQSIAAYAHLLCLLLQNRELFFHPTVANIRENMDELLAFLTVPAGGSGGGGSSESLPAWLPHFFLLFELLLTEDEQQPKVKWLAPPVEAKKMPDLEVETKNLIVDESRRTVLLGAIMDVLPRIGKDEALAVSVTRILVILTRNHDVAKVVGDKKNLHRLFLMVKQLAGFGASGFKDSRLSNYVATILRHIVEDEETLRPIMRTEIRHFFYGATYRAHRPVSLAVFLQNMAPVALRNPKVFVSVVDEMMMLSRYPADEHYMVEMKLGALYGGESGNANANAQTSPASREDSSADQAAPGTESTAAAVATASTEDRVMPDAPAKSENATVSENKRPVVTNPDGVITFLLEQLMAYQKVDDTEPSAAAKEAANAPLGTDISMSAAPTPGTSGEEPTAPASPASTAAVPDVTVVPASGSVQEKAKDGKPTGEVFKTADHPIFVFRGFLMFCLSELLQSYKRSKMEFINFKRGVTLQSHTPVKPRSSVLNYLLHDVLCGAHTTPSTPMDSVAGKKKQAMAEVARRVIIALVERTTETALDRSQLTFDSDADTDMLFIRRFVLDTILRAYKETAASTNESLDIRYGKMACLAELMAAMVGADKDRSLIKHSPFNESNTAHSQMQLRRLMYEKGFTAALTHSVADIDLSFPGSKRTLMHVLRVLHVLSGTVIDLSRHNLIPQTPAADANDAAEYDSVSSSSLSDMHDEREETPDLYRNSSLGMLEGNDDQDDEYSESGDEEDMYDDEMDYDDDITDDGEENPSDEDDDEMGPVEGLHGDSNIVEVIMDDGEEEDDEDEDDEDDEDEDDEVGSEEMDDLDDQIEEAIEELDEEDVMDDDGASEWVSANEEDDEGEDGELEDEQDQVDDAFNFEEAMHGENNPMGHFEEIVRPMQADWLDEEYVQAHEDAHLEEGAEDDEVDEDEDLMEEDELIYEHDELYDNARLENIPMDPEDGYHFRRHPRSGGHHHNFGNLFRHERGPPPDAEDASNPLLHRAGASPREPARPSNSSGRMLRLGLPRGMFAGSDNPMAILRELMASLPQLAQHSSQPLHFQITQGPHGEIRELSLPMPHVILDRTHHDAARSDTGSPEPSQAILFRTAQTSERWSFETRMVFGANHASKVGDALTARILYLLVPPAIQKVLNEREIEEELALIEEGNRKRLEQAREEQEAKEAQAAKEAAEAATREAEERAEREREEEEMRAAIAAAAADEAAEEEAAATAAAANADADDAEAGDEERNRDTSEPMEGVETASEAGGEGAAAGDSEPAVTEPAVTEPAQPEPPRQRITTTIRGEEIDVTSLGIDPEYLAELPEEFREEVIAGTYAARRTEARQQAESSGAVAEQDETFEAFLNALPDDLRMEIVQQERAEQRRRQREEERERRQQQLGSAGAAAAAEQAAQEMDTASILLTFPPELREQILLEQGEELLDHLPPEMAAQARTLAEANRPPPPRMARMRVNQPRAGASGGAAVTIVAGGQQRSGAGGEASGTGAAGAAAGTVTKPERRPVVQIMDRAGIATLLRLLFVSQRGTAHLCLFNLFMDLCQNRQSRLEIVSTLLQILQDGSTDKDTAERCFAQLSCRSKQLPKDKDGSKDSGKSAISGAPGSSSAITTTPGTGGSAKRGGGGAAMTPFSTGVTHLETSPLLIVQQCLDVLVDLCTRNQHIPSLLLSEHDLLGASLRKSFASRKAAKSAQSRASRYGINMLLQLLEKELVMESSAIMQQVADLLNRVTQPLQTLERRRREEEQMRKEAEAKEKEEKEKEEKEKEEEGGEASSSGNTAAVAAEGSSTEKPAETKTDTITVQPPKARDLEPPYIPEHNLALVINIFVARECTSKTFQNTISTIKNLCCLGAEAKELFGRELTRQAKALSETILKDLEELLPDITAAGSGTEIQGIALAKFSPGAAEQNKLLRVLTALDHLFGAQKKGEPSSMEDKADKADKDDKDDKQPKDDYMSDLYHNVTFVKMWGRLSACLGTIRQKDNMLNIATILLPLIESFMVVCKNASLNEARWAEATAQQMAQSGTLGGSGEEESKDKGKEVAEPEQKEPRRSLLSSPAPDEAERAWDLFFEFSEDHRRVLNELVRNNPKLMSGTFSLLVKNPKVLEFDNKRNYFNRSVHAKTSQQQQQRAQLPTLHLSVRREQVFLDSFKSLYFKTGYEMKYGKLNIRFHGEEGVDAGGVTREWFSVLARQMFDANYALFIPVSSDRTTFHPNKLSGINDEHLMFFKFIGRVIGKALYEGRLLEAYFSRAVYKRILGKTVSVKDMESFDPEYYKSLVWMLENDITDVITETFSVVDDEFGVTTVVDLVPGGRDIAVTEENKQEYVRLVVEHKLLTSVKEQMEHFLRGFHEIIPAELISIFTEQELELLISGLPDIDIDDWRANTEYHNYTATAPQIQWFWRAVRSFDVEERAKLLQFVTGTSKVPLNGFKELEGMNGINRFNIHRDYGNKDRLPSSHTCFNQLDLPEYESYDQLRSQLLKAITAGNEYFGFA